MNSKNLKQKKPLSNTVGSVTIGVGAIGGSVKKINDHVNGSVDTPLRKYSTFESFIPVDRLNDPRESSGGTIKLAVTFCVPISISNSGAIERLPVILESLPYRKNDSEYPIRPNQWDYFTSRGFIYAQVDLRGTGSSEGKRLEYEYTKAEILDLTQVIEYLTDSNLSTWFDGKIVTNGCIGMWGQSWSAFNSLILSGWKNDPTVPQSIKNRLIGLKTIVPMHGAINLYEGDIHYMDGILHFDEYILSIDHENAMPSPGDMSENNGYKIDNDFYKNRWTEEPWSFFYLGKYLKYPKEDPGFWTERLRFINGPFTKSYPFSYNMPTFVIGSLLDGYRDAAVQLYQTLKTNQVCVKFAMSPGDHTIPDETYIPNLWEWREPVVEWFKYWLSPNVSIPSNGTLPDPVADNEFAIYVRNPVKNEFDGVWRNETWPIPNNRKYTALSKLYLKSDSTLGGTCNNCVGTLVGLDYDATVGTETNVWWGDTNPNMVTLDDKALTFTTDVLSDDVELLGFPEINLITMIKNKDSNIYDKTLNMQIHVRVEDINSDGYSQLVTGGSINTAYPNQDAPASSTNAVYIEDSKQFSIKVRLHFTTWTFLKGHKIRISITNALFRMMWPTRFNMEGKISVNNSNTYINLPVYTKPSVVKPPPYTSRPSIKYVYAPDTFYFYNGGYPSIYQNPVPGIPNQVYWYSDYYSLCRGWIVSVLISHRDTSNKETPEIASWDGYALQRYQYVGVSNSNLWPGLDVTKPGPNVPPVGRSFQINTRLTITSDFNKIYANLKRTLIEPAPPGIPTVQDLENFPTNPDLTYSLGKFWNRNGMFQ